MASFNLETVAVTPRATSDDNLKVSFRLPASSTATDPLRPATALQISVSKGEHEAFIERLTARDVARSDTDEGLCWVQVPAREVPTFAQAEGDLRVHLHAWKGEKWLGKWDVGTW